MHESRCPEIGPACAEGEVPPELHDQRSTVVEPRVVAAVGLTARWGAELHLPLRVHAVSIEYRRVDGTPFEPAHADLHHRDETLTGLADPWVLARFSAPPLGGVTATAKLGFTVPLAQTEPNPFVLGAEGRPHQHVQHGTGTFDPVAALELRRALGAWRVGAHAQARFVLAENDEGYRAGHRFAVGASAALALGRWELGATADVVSERPERWDGIVHEDGNLGRTDVLFGARGGVALGGVDLAIGVRVPVVQVLATRGDEPSELSYPAVVDVSIGRRFQLGGG